MNPFYITVMCGLRVEKWPAFFCWAEINFYKNTVTQVHGVLMLWIDKHKMESQIPNESQIEIHPTMSVIPASKNT